MPSVPSVMSSGCLWECNIAHLLASLHVGLVNWGKERMGFPPLWQCMSQRRPTQSVSLHLWLMQLRDVHATGKPALEREVLGPCFHGFRALLPKCFCSKELNIWICQERKRAFLTWWLAYTAKLSQPDRRCSAAVRPNKAMFRHLTSKQAWEPSELVSTSYQTARTDFRPVYVKSQKKGRNPLWQPLYWAPWQGLRSRERVWRPLHDASPKALQYTTTSES